MIQIAYSSLPGTLSLYNAFMWTVSVNAAQSELNESDGRPNATHNEGSPYHRVTFLNLYIPCRCFSFQLLESDKTDLDCWLCLGSAYLKADKHDLALKVSVITPADMSVLSNQSKKLFHTLTINYNIFKKN